MASCSTFMRLPIAVLSFWLRLLAGVASVLREGVGGSSSSTSAGPLSGNMLSSSLFTFINKVSLIST
ncbi:hypothetical protein V5799_008291 [Amblyomma americanum]|uniref:Secreted protein n=1 Tax=Amblyomma americanum TaxID=6943 RepID=A0AAQ4FFA8_AMBAM